MGKSFLVSVFLKEKITAFIFKLFDKVRNSIFCLHEFHYFLFTCGKILLLQLVIQLTLYRIKYNSYEKKRNKKRSLTQYVCKNVGYV